jgi:hypothetical protein
VLGVVAHAIPSSNGYATNSGGCSHDHPLERIDGYSGCLPTTISVSDDRAPVDVPHPDDDRRLAAALRDLADQLERG